MVKLSTLMTVALLIAFPLEAKVQMKNEEAFGITSDSLANRVRQTSFAHISEFDLTRVNETHLRAILNVSQGYCPDKSEVPSAKHKTQFETCFKAYTLLHMLGHLKMDEFSHFYGEVQTHLVEAEGEFGELVENPAHYVYWSACFALLNADVRTSISQKFRAGTSPFPKDVDQASYLAGLPNLPLSGTTLFEWREKNANFCPLPKAKARDK